MKKRIIAILIVLLVIGLGGFFGIRAYRKHKMNANPVKAVSVEVFSSFYSMGPDSKSYDGNVVVNNQQNVRIPEQNVVNELKVSEGMVVHPGDVLLTYDMTSANLELEMMNAQLFQYQANLTVRQHELDKLKATVPLEDLPPEPEPQPQPEPEPQPDKDNNSGTASPTDAQQETEKPKEEPQPEQPTENPGTPGEGAPDEGAPEPEPVPTRAELTAAIRDKEKQINTAYYQVEMQKLNIQKKELKLAQGEVRATITGVVQKADVSEEARASGEPCIVVTAQQAVTVQIYVDEMEVKKMKLGTEAQIFSYDNSYYYSGSITEIGMEPDPNYYGYAEYETSWYPITISVDQDDPEQPVLKNGDWLSVTISSGVEEDQEEEKLITIPTFMVNEEDGRSFVMKDVNGHLARQYVSTGKSYYGSFVEIRSGLSMTDYIAFPYSENAVEGKACVRTDDIQSIK